ncbi:MAG: hypothetical protein HY906_14490 [Deltaproteobacteria bacterium]|nr:hypothetical protein [Deltaproteobacteria bacterium]
MLWKIMCAGGRFTWGWIVKLLDNSSDCPTCGHRMWRHAPPSEGTTPDQDRGRGAA